MERNIILASTSPRRIEIFGRCGLLFSTIAPIYEEDMTLQLEPEALANGLSLGKALTVAKDHLDAIVIAGDTFIVFGGRVLGKPHTPERAKEMLRLLSGSAHTILSGFSVVYLPQKKTIQVTERTEVLFRPISDLEIDEYVATGEPLDRAGGYAIQGGAAKFVEQLDGDYENALGLPLKRLLQVLKEEFGIVP